MRFADAKSRGARESLRRCVGVGLLVAVPAMALGCNDEPGDSGGTSAVSGEGSAPGTGVPPEGTGIDTPAAFENPLCDRDEGPYGKLNFIVKGGGPDRGGGPICVAEWDGSDNGGSTHQGVTEDSVKVVALVPNAEQNSSVRAQAQLPIDNATGETGTMEDALRDALVPYQEFFETYGREVQLDVVTSSGSDEAAQRADAVTVTSTEPFVVVDATTDGLEFFEAAIASDEIPVFGAATSIESTMKQAPYRWGQADALAGALNVAEFVGKQLAGKDAEFAGEALQREQRAFGVVYSNVDIDIEMFNAELEENGGEIAPDAAINYPATGSPTGDPAIAQEQAPTAVTRLKEAGATSVILMADVAMITAMLDQATAQDYEPEWIIAGYQYTDNPIFARGYNQEQWSHAFGISNLPPGIENVEPALVDVVQWYWGEGKGTSSGWASNVINWVMSGVMYAGPNLTPETWRQGFFSVPAAGGAPSDDPGSVLHGYGRTPGLPYDEYLRGNLDFTVVWWDPDTVGPTLPGFPDGQGVLWYVDGGQRYFAGEWPTEPITFFDKSNSILEFATAPMPVEPVPCPGCPSETGRGQPSGS